jgi:Flp pilus assembly protein TadD
MDRKWKRALGGIAVAAVAMMVGCRSDPTVVVVDTSRLEMETHLHQGIAFVNQGDYPNAIVEFKTAIAVLPTADAYSNLGAAYMQLGKNNLALEALNNAKALDPNDPIVLYNLAALYSVTGKTDMSLVYLGRALSKGFNNYDAIRFDPDLENVRGEPEFRKVLESHKVFIQ